MARTTILSNGAERLQLRRPIWDSSEVAVKNNFLGREPCNQSVGSECKAGPPTYVTCGLRSHLFTSLVGCRLLINIIVGRGAVSQLSGMQPVARQ